METRNKYGSVPGLPDEELADPEELERQVFLEEWGAILALPVRDAPIVRADIDEYGGVDWGAFGTVDFERISPKFDKVRYKIDKLKEKRRDVRMMIDTVSYRVRGTNKDAVLKYAVQGVIDVDDILDEDIKGLVKLYLRVRRLTEEIEQLWKARQRPEGAWGNGDAGTVGVISTPFLLSQGGCSACPRRLSPWRSESAAFRR